VRSRRGIYANVIAKREARSGELVEGEIAERVLVSEVQPVFFGFHHGLSFEKLQLVAISSDVATNLSLLDKTRPKSG
jgi:hypothetical protein